MDWLDVLYVFLAVLICGLAAWIAWWRPLRRLQRLLDRMAGGETVKSCFIDSPRWFHGMERDLEKLSKRLRDQQQIFNEAEFNIHAILSSMAEGVMVVDAQHRILLVNDELNKLFDLKQDPTHRTALEALREADVELILRETLQKGQPVAREVTLVTVQSEGQSLEVQINTVPVRNEAGVIQGVVAVFHDISRVKQLESVRREFVSNVSHELRTPLSIFRGYLETLLDNPGLPPEDVSRILDTMRRHSDRLNALVEDLLTLTRLESRKEQLQPMALKLDEFVAQILRDYKSKIENEKAEVTVQIPADLPVLMADPRRLEQVLINLLDNSLVYSKPPKRIEIGAEADGKEVLLRVRDNGIGIPTADLPRIFERFYRVDKARSREKGGTGLGLSIVKHIAQLHGGSVMAESEFGHWTQITVRLPNKTA
jgi:two-component system, OmpR family, phosphate regulon sensor histidine kinase PhoR